MTNHKLAVITTSVFALCIFMTLIQDSLSSQTYENLNGMAIAVWMFFLVWGVVRLWKSKE